MNPDENENAWEDLGYIMKQEPQSYMPTRSSYQEERARRCLDELRKMLGKKNDL